MDIDTADLLGQFLRARRELLRPEDLGMSGGAGWRDCAVRRSRSSKA